jgi:hypothetical protein
MMQRQSVILHKESNSEVSTPHKQADTRTAALNVAGGAAHLCCPKI